MPRRTVSSSPPGPVSLLALYPLFFSLVYLSHLTLLRLPYYWDEGGYYIPAALDFLHTGTLVPHTTITNAHPPLPMVLLAAAWKVTGVVVSGTRTFVCMIAAAALLAVFRLARTYLGDSGGAAVAALTALYPIWYVQSTLAHADIFAAAFTLWALALYLPAIATAQTLSPQPEANEDHPAQPGAPSTRRLYRRLGGSHHLWIAVLFALSVLSKETAIVTPFLLSCHHLWLAIRRPAERRLHLTWLASVAFCVLPLIAWYAYHQHITGFVFGNPEYLRYNATANMDAHRIALSLYHRALHLLTHMNMWVALVLTAACFLLPKRFENQIPRPALNTLALLIVGNWIAFSVLGGALLTRYLLPVYPLLLLLGVALWQQRSRQWAALALFPAAAFVLALHYNPPYAFAPEDNLTYRDMIVLHQQAIALIDAKFPKATVLTAWPANAELQHPFLGYTREPVKVSTLINFAPDQIDKAAQNPGDYDTALLFSTKYEPPAGRTNLSAPMQNSDAKYFDFHRDMLPAEVARKLHGDIVWQRYRNGEWAAILRFPRSFEAQLR